jgi:ribosomal protein S4
MVQRFNKYTLKFCKFYEEDVYGRFAIRPKRSHKSLNIVYADLFKHSKKIRNLYKLYIKIFYNLKNNLKILRKLLNVASKDRNVRREKFFLYTRLKNIILNVIKFIKENQKNFNLNEGKFNYRVDIGKPSRKKRRITKFSLRLLARHKLSSFAGKIPISQFKHYVTLNRNLKYFSLNFLFLIESRVDVILYRLNFSQSPGYIRQYIRHNGVLVNNKLIKVPSYQISINDTLSFIDKKEVFNKIFYNFQKKIVFMSLPVYYEVNFRLMLVKFYLIPRLEMIFYPFQVDKLRLSSFCKQF